MAYGSPARVHGANRVGLDVRVWMPAAVAAVHEAYAHGVELDVSALDLPERIRLALAANAA